MHSRHDCRRDFLTSDSFVPSMSGQENCLDDALLKITIFGRNEKNSEEKDMLWNLRSKFNSCITDWLLKIPIIKNERVRSVYKIMRGYRTLKKAKMLSMPSDIKKAWTVAELGMQQSDFSHLLFGSAHSKSEVICRQFLLLRLAGVNFNKALLKSFSGKRQRRLYYPVPPLWREIATNYGVIMPKRIASVIWNSFIFAMLCHGIVTILRILLGSVLKTLSGEGNNLGKYAYFSALNSNNLPFNSSRDSRTVTTWFAKWPGRSKEINAICHNVSDVPTFNYGTLEIIPMGSPVLPLSNGKQVLAFARWALKAVAISTIDFLRGKWWHPLMLGEAALSANVRMQNKSALAVEYLFNISSWIYRPMWTYEAERQESNITFYYYSVNNEGISLNQTALSPHYGLKSMTWPCHLSWNEEHSSAIRRIVSDDIQIKVSGIIPFEDTPSNVPDFEGYGVAVFDVTPVRDYIYMTLCPPFDYYFARTSVKFMDDIYAITSELNYSLLWKKKRKVGKKAHPAYRRFSDNFSNRSGVRTVDPGISAIRLIEKSDFVISMPFTSTAVIAKDLGRPSVFYDPLEIIQADDRASLGVKVLRGRAELDAWVRSLCF